MALKLMMKSRHCLCAERQIATNPAKFVKNFGEKRFATSHVDSFQNAVRSKLILGTEYLKNDQTVWFQGLNLAHLHV